MEYLILNILFFFSYSHLDLFYEIRFLKKVTESHEIY